MTNPSRAFAAALVSTLLGVSGCGQSEPPEFSFYGERIAPLLEVGCAVQTTGCHVATSDQAAVGNLDLSSFDALMRRRDTLPALGPYSVGQLLLKGGDPIEVAVQTFDAPVGAPSDQRVVAVTTDVRHAGGVVLRVGSDGYAKLKSWIAQGYQRNGAVTEQLSKSEGECNPEPGSHKGFDPSQAPASEFYAEFRQSIQPVLVQR